MVGLHQFFAGELVEIGRQSLGLAPGIAEDDRGAVGQHLSKHRGIHALPNVAHLLDRHDDVDFHLLADACVDDVDLAPAIVGAVPAEEVGNLFERPLGGRQADALRWSDRDGLEPFERQHQMGTTLGRGHRVNLVDDHRVDVDERVGDRRRQHQVQALGCRDEQIDWVANQRLTILRRGVAGAHGDRRLMERHAEPLGRQPDPHQRGAQVLLDVERQSPQRRDVQHTRPALGVRRLCRAQPVDRSQKRRQGLAAACRGAYQRVVATKDRRPTIDLGGGWRRE